MLVTISCTVTSITAFSVTKKPQKSRKKAELSWGNTIHEETKAALTMTQETMKSNYDKKKGLSWEYKVGDKVWLEGTNILTDWPINKLDDKQHGPFTITKKEGETQSPKNLKTYPPRVQRKVFDPLHPFTISLATTTQTHSPHYYWRRRRIQDRWTHGLQIITREASIPCEMERLSQPCRLDLGTRIKDSPW